MDDLSEQVLFALDPNKKSPTPLPKVRGSIIATATICGFSECNLPQPHAQSAIGAGRLFLRSTRRVPLLYFADGGWLNRAEGPKGSPALEISPNTCSGLQSLGRLSYERRHLPFCKGYADLRKK